MVSEIRHAMSEVNLISLEQEMSTITKCCFGAIVLKEMVISRFFKTTPPPPSIRQVHPKSALDAAEYLKPGDADAQQARPRFIELVIDPSIFPGL